MSVDNTDRQLSYDELVSKLIEKDIPDFLDNVNKRSSVGETKLIESVRELLDIGLDKNGKEIKQRLDVTKRDDLYSVAFFGFSSNKSTAFSSRTLSGLINDNKTYTKFAEDVAHAIFRNDNSCFKYFINDEAWLLDKLRKAKADISQTIGLPEVIVCPYDVTFSDEVNALITELSITVQRISLKKEDDLDVLSFVEKVEYDRVNGEQVVSRAGNFDNSIMQIESEIRNNKLFKYNRYFRKKFADIDLELSNEFDNKITNYDGKGKLYLHTVTGYDVLLDDLDYLTSLKLESGEYIKDETGKKINYDIIKESLLVLKNKQDSLMDRIIDLYKDRDIVTYYHVTRMCKLVDVINSGFSSEEKLNEVEVARLKKMVVLHDIGKLTTPSPILDKSGKLFGEDKDIMDSHVHYENIHLILDDYLSSLLKAALLHHKGAKGYADPKLENETKDKLSKILSVLDVFEALTTNKRPYRKGAVPDFVLYDEMNKKMNDEKLFDYKQAYALLYKTGYDVSKLISSDRVDEIGSNAIEFNVVEEDSSRKMGK